MRAPLLTTSMLAVACNADIPPPMISSIFPDHGPPGIQVTIEGNYFCQQPESEEEDPLACENTGTVSFDQQPAEVLQYLETSIMVTAPEHDAAEVPVVVHVLGLTSRSVSFTITP
ncbi:MAG: IPT/TIG domain-containing protein [Kofleriaceae bacterium]